MLSIVVPVFNEEAALPVFYEVMRPVIVEISGLLGPAGEIELVFVDDGSRDGTVGAVHAVSGYPARIRLVKLSRNFGKDSALTAGLRHARGDAVVPMDVDLQDPPEVLPRMVEAWLQGAWIVNAVRSDRSSDTVAKRVSASAFYRLYNRLADTPIEANVGDFRLMDREVVEVINLMPERIRFMKGLFSWLGYSPVQVEYVRPERSEGITKWKFWGLWNFALDGITGSTTLPLRIWTYIGGLVAIGALLFLFFIVLRTLLFGTDVPGYASLMVVTLAFGALNMIAVGILGEYVGRIAIEVRQRPLYIVESIEDLPAQTESPECRQRD